MRSRSLLHFRAGADVADIALDDVLAIDQINVTDELDLDVLSAPRDQGKVFIADILIVLQLLEGLFVCGDILELADFPELESDDFPKLVVQKIEQKRICIDDLARLAIENQDSVLRRFEQSAIAQFGSTQGKFPHIYVAVPRRSARGFGNCVFHVSRTTQSPRRLITAAAMSRDMVGRIPIHTLSP